MNQNRMERKAPDGSTITISAFCSPETIRLLSIDPTFKEYGRYSPIVSKIETLSTLASNPDANVTLAITAQQTIVGIAILQYPAPDERWVRVGNRIMMEVSVVEVARPFRGTGLSTALLEQVIDHPQKKDRILYMVGYSWTWDLETTQVPVMTYRDMMIHLFSKFGFKIYQTNEPNIMMRPENVFMARIGENVSEAVRKTFKMVLFNMDQYL